MPRSKGVQSNWSAIRLLCKPLPAEMVVSFQRYYNIHKEKNKEKKRKRKRTAPDGPPAAEQHLLGLVRWLQHIAARPGRPWPALVDAAAAARDTVQALLLLPALAHAVG